MRRWRYRVSLRGSTHREKHIPNQDSATIRFIKEGVWVLIVCDGVSACEKAKEASAFVMKQFVRMLTHAICKQKREPGCDLLCEIAQDVRTALLGLVTVNNEDISEWGTTAEVALVSEGHVYILHAGDGAIVTVTKEGRINITSSDRHTGEVAHSVIPFSEKYGWEFIDVKEECTQVAVMSDGVYEMVSPICLRPYGYKFEPFYLLPLLDRRICELKKTSHQQAVKSMIQDRFDSVILGKRMTDFYRKGLIVQSDMGGLEDDEIEKRGEKIPSPAVGDDKSVCVLGLDCPEKYIGIEFPDYEYIYDMDFRKSYPHLVIA